MVSAQHVTPFMRSWTRLLEGFLTSKSEYKNGALRLKAIHLEPSIKPAEELVQAAATAMHDFMDFHAAKELFIKHSEPAELSSELLK